MFTLDATLDTVLPIRTVLHYFANYVSNFILFLNDSTFLNELSELMIQYAIHKDSC